MAWLKAIAHALKKLFSAQTITNERPEIADPTHHDELQCRHCSHIHREIDGSCDCGCTLLEL